MKHGTRSMPHAGMGASGTPPPLPPRRITRDPPSLSSSESSNVPPTLPPRRISPAQEAPSNPPPAPPEELCRPCSEINFAQFHGPSSGPTLNAQENEAAYLLQLKPLLEKRYSCRFCNLLFQALCLPANDPLKDQEIQDSIQKEKYFQERRSSDAPFWVDFETWATGREKLKYHFKKAAEAKWPFGVTYDSLTVGESGNKEGMEVDLEEDEDNRAEVAALNQGSRVGLATAQQFDNNAQRGKLYGWTQAVLPDSGLLMVLSKNKVPAALRIIVYGALHPKAGVLEVKFWGTSRAVGRQLRMLSNFHLRVASPEFSVNQNQQLRYGRPIKQKTIDLDLCRRWLNHCRTLHCDTCNAPRWAATLEKPDGIVFRLIDVLNNALVKFNLNVPDYVALSYVWGGPEHQERGVMHLDKSNVDSFCVRNSISRNVGRTIWDAMEVVRGLGMRYLWADRMCIVQNSPDDMMKQIAQMDRIYGNAVVTMVVATGEHLNSGITGVGTDRLVSQLAQEIIQNPRINVLLPVGSNPDLGPWENRAWTLQEKLLSRRILLFHHGMVDYYCTSGTMHEDMTAEDADSNLKPIGWLSLADDRLFSSIRQQRYGGSGPKLLRSAIFGEYVGIIEQYTPRRMTDARDAINAVSGMLKILITNQQATNARKPLLYGLPEEFFDQAFHWQPATGDNVRLQLRPGTNFPTWSWAAWESIDKDHSGGVRYEAPFHVQTNERGALLKVVTDQVPSKSSKQEPPEERLRDGLALDPDVDLAQWQASIAHATKGLTPDINSSSIPLTRLEIRETAVLDGSGEQVGKVVLPDPEAQPGLGGAGAPPSSPGSGWLFDFIMVSEAQFFGDERNVEVGEYPLFNVMLVKWGEGRRPFATRVAMGKITKDACYKYLCENMDKKDFDKSAKIPHDLTPEYWPALQTITLTAYILGWDKTAAIFQYRADGTSPATVSFESSWPYSMKQYIKDRWEAVASEGLSSRYPCLFRAELIAEFDGNLVKFLQEKVATLDKVLDPHSLKSMVRALKRIGDYNLNIEDILKAT
ncbi:heterokaryon incompatibility protein-domain-containing protein [Bombardia bombarda]|uniref:Heterokaryon incompatibility protein-domain-containing protein n=1 Tax=Bombardia bombarda TaxID=252184 RepID=A0AA39XPL1_9PEZI|nr:heterokaryon incompatibility protein-domain-containing protein [Bombardia bombarda]